MQYFTQPRLLMNVLPIAAGYADFALKGGTALNYLVHDMPRLSVDVDLQYLPITPYDQAQQDIRHRIESLCSDISRTLPGARCQYLHRHKRIMVRDHGVDIKIETNGVARGCVIEPVQYSLCEKASRAFGVFMMSSCLSEAELYAGKLVAALDRQHPRDTFDMCFLLNRTGVLDKRIIQVFVVYLAGSRGSISEILDPRLTDITETFKKRFSGMANHDIKLNELVQMQCQLPGMLRGLLTEKDREFLLSFKRGGPDWDLLPFPHVGELPAIRWKMVNLDAMGI